MGRVQLLHEELSFQIRGILYIVHNYLGPYRSEKQFCDAIAYGFTKRNIPFEREKVIPIQFIGERPGRNRVDFLVANAVILEVKTVPCITKQHYHQCMRYLVGLDKDLCLLVNFQTESLFIKRILNPNNLKKLT